MLLVMLKAPSAPMTRDSFRLRQESGDLIAAVAIAMKPSGALALDVASFWNDHFES